MEKVKAVVPRIFDSIKTNDPGYLLDTVEKIQFLNT